MKLKENEKLSFYIGIILLIVGLLFVYYIDHTRTMYDLVEEDLVGVDLEPMQLLVRREIEEGVLTGFPINEEGRNKMIRLMKKTKLIHRTVEVDDLNKGEEYEFYIQFDSKNKYDPNRFAFTVSKDISIDKVRGVVFQNGYEYPYYSENDELYDGIIDILENHIEY